MEEVRDRLLRALFVEATILELVQTTIDTQGL
jgi:hypothetical protein